MGIVRHTVGCFEAPPWSVFQELECSYSPIYYGFGTNRHSTWHPFDNSRNLLTLILHFRIYSVTIVLQPNRVWLWHPFDNSKSLFNPNTTNLGVGRPQEGASKPILVFISGYRVLIFTYSPISYSPGDPRREYWNPFLCSSYRSATPSGFTVVWLSRNRNWLWHPFDNLYDSFTTNKGIGDPEYYFKGTVDM